MNKRLVVGLLLVVFCLLATASLVLAGGSECDQSPNCEKFDDPGNSGSADAPGTITSFVIKAGQGEFSFGQGSFDDGCYRGNVSGSHVSWEKYGDGPACKDVSHVQLWWTSSDDPPDDDPPGDEPPGDEPPGDEPPGDEPPGDEPPGEPPVIPPLDACDVYNDAFAVDVELAFGVYGWDIAAYAPYDHANPTKRGLVFQTGVLVDGRQVFIVGPDGEMHLYTVEREAGGPPHCVQPEVTVEEPVVTEGEYCVANGEFGYYRGIDAVYFSLGCDPYVQIFVDGVLMFEDATFGNERVRVPAPQSARIEIWVEHELWGYYEPYSDELQR